MDTSNLQGRTVLVTGAASGIGRATALLAARRGAELVVCDRDRTGIAELESTIRGVGTCVLAGCVDVAERDQMREFAEAVHAERAAVDLLVNNAGVGLAATFLETEAEDWDWIVSINLLGVVHGCHFFLPNMVARGAGGHVVNLASMAGYRASLRVAAYSATKFAVLGLSEALREELRPHGIGVTAVCPGIVSTSIPHNARWRGQAADPRTRERVTERYRRRNYPPERVAHRILEAVQRNRAVAPVGREAWIAYALKRTSPRLASRIARRTSSVR